jgi:hypothetical protein
MPADAVRCRDQIFTRASDLTHASPHPRGAWRCWANTGADTSVRHGVMCRFLAAPLSSDGASSGRIEQAWEGSIPFLGTLPISLNGVIESKKSGRRCRIRAEVFVDLHQHPWRSARTMLSDRPSGDVLAMLSVKAFRRRRRLGLAKLSSLLALLLGLIGRSSLVRGCRRQSGVVASETRPTIRWHGPRSLRLRTRPRQGRSDSLSGAFHSRQTLRSWISHAWSSACQARRRAQ